MVELYFSEGTLVAKSGLAKVYEFNSTLFLELGTGHTLKDTEADLSTYIDLLWDAPRGNCLEIGLGLGVASRYILSCPAVDKLTTLEVDSSIIAVYSSVIPILNSRKREQGSFNKEHTIINEEVLQYLYTTSECYDFIFINNDSLPMTKDMVQASKKVLSKDGIVVTSLSF